MNRNTPQGKDWNSFSFGFSLGRANRPLKAQYSNPNTAFLSGYRCGLASRGLSQLDIDVVMTRYTRLAA